MRAFNRVFAVVLIIIAIVFAGANIIIMNIGTSDSGRPYRVEISRLVRSIDEEGYEAADISECEYVTAVVRYSDGDESFYDAESDYSVREIDGEMYRFDYTASSAGNKSMLITINIILGVMSAVIIAVMLYIRVKILAPFDKLKEVPYELSKGNLTVPVKENSNHFFGRFVWGVDLLRENMEQAKQRELALQKEKKTLLLSLSHDVKTPLSAIKLYAKALSKGLYSQKEKQTEIAESINAKADEIEVYISQIISASNEDFLQLEVRRGEFYLSELVNSIHIYYKEKLQLIHTSFVIDEYSNCLISGDFDRSVEVLQNVMENAIKYGDGQQIEIFFSDEDGCQLVTIKNSGCTLPETELLHIFDSFWRGSNAENKTGSGLGLYICRQLMRRMNGEIFAEITGGCMAVTVVFSKA